MTSAKLNSFLRSWHATSGANQIKAGKRFDLTYEEFLSLWSPKDIQKLERWVDDGSLYMRMNPQNDEAYVLSWATYADSQGEVMNVHNARIHRRKDSLKACRLGKGDKHSTRAREKMSRSHTGKTKPDATKAKIASSMVGVHVGRKGSADESANKSAAQKERWARYRAEKAAEQAQRGDA